MSDEKDTYYFVSHPRTPKRSIFPLTTADIMWIWIIAIVAAYIGSFFVGFQNLVYIGAFIFVFATLMPAPGGDDSWYYITLVAPIRNFLIWRRHDVIWKEGMSDDMYPYKVHVFHDIALVYYTVRRTYSVVFLVGGSNISTLKLGGQMGVHASIKDVIEKAAVQTGIDGIRINYGYDILPGNPFDVSYANIERVNLNALSKSLRITDKPEGEYSPEEKRWSFRRQLLNEMEEAGVQGTNPRMVYTVTFKNNRVFRKILKRKVFWSSDLRKQSLVSVRDTLTKLLGGIYEDVQVLGQEALEAYLRQARDVAKIHFYYGENHLAMVEAEDKDENVMFPSDRFAPSQHIIAKNDRLQIDGTLATVFELDEFPLDQPPVNYVRDFSGVFDLPVMFFSTDIAGKSRSGRARRVFVDVANTFGDQGMKFIGRERSSRKEAKVEESREQEAERIDRKYTVDFKPTVAVYGVTDTNDFQRLYNRYLNSPEFSGMTPEEIFAYEVKQADNHLDLHGLEPVRVKGRFRQMETVLGTIMHIPTR